MSDASAPLLAAEGLTHRYGAGETVLDDIRFCVREGEKVVLLGCNGSGKSTLLKILDGLVTPTAGSYRYCGEQITRRHLKSRTLQRRFRAEVGLLFQNPDAMLFNPSVFDEIAFGPRQAGLADIDARVHRWAERLGLRAHLRRPPFGLSGGEKQKVCLAALLAMEPRLLLLDEPTSALDPRSTGWLVDFLADLGQTLLISTHNLGLAPELADRALVLGEDHRLCFDGPVGDFLADPEALVRANLAHRHRHRHRGAEGTVEHSHFHTHDWS